ncbi:MAG TPA: hypothetical protein VLM79_32290 [Kofleriaceae bacterium]|nr:hypothetical protein [Kofleriaceae bacterium]
MLRKPELVTWAIYLFLVPVYIFSSGLPQPGDAVILILVPIVLQHWNGRVSRDVRPVLRALLWFTLWVCAVNYTWMLVTGSFTLFGTDSYMLYPVYYIYNALIFLAAIVMYRRYGDLFLRVTVFAVTTTVFVQVLSSLVFRSNALRGSVFFNNPNQLGYFSLLAATLIALTHRRLQLRMVVSALALVCCGYLALVSASRAAAGGIACLIVVLVFSNPRVIVVASIAAAVVVGGVGPIADAIDASQARILNLSARGDRSFLEERGYDRIWRNQQYLVLGAGEGGLSRFNDTAFVKNMEIHSSAGTILFSYGIVGSILFAVFTWRIIRRARLRLIFMLLPPLLYTFAHQGLRFTLLWVVLAIFLALKEEVERPRQIQPDGSFGLARGENRLPVTASGNLGGAGPCV